MLHNPFVTRAKDMAGIPMDYIPVTPGASPLGFVAIGLYIGGAGNVTVTTYGGNSRTIPVFEGQFLPGAFTHVTAATATNIFALVG